jgi:hypothetical protein
MHAHGAHFQLAGDLRLGQPTSGKQSCRLLAPGLQAFEVSTGSKGLAHEQAYSDTPPWEVQIITILCEDQ